MDIVALGELLVDFTGDRTDPAVFAANPGGAPANYLAAASAAGAQTALLAKVGADLFGDRLVAALAKNGIEARGVVRDDSAFTTLAFVSLDAAGERRFAFSRKPGADTLLTFEELDLSLLEGARLFHCGSLSLTDEPARETTRRAAAYAREKGLLLSFDPNYRPALWRDAGEAKTEMLWGCGQADIVKLSEEEAVFLFDDGPEDAARALLAAYGCSLVFVTLGKNGAYFANPRCAGFVPAYEGVRTVDTTGAGDVFGGSAAALLLETGISPAGLDADALRRIARYACTAAGLSTGRYGGLGSAPARETVLQITENRAKMQI